MLITANNQPANEQTFYITSQRNVSLNSKNKLFDIFFATTLFPFSFLTFSTHYRKFVHRVPFHQLCLQQDPLHRFFRFFNARDEQLRGQLPHPSIWLGLSVGAW